MKLILTLFFQYYLINPAVFTNRFDFKRISLSKFSCDLTDNPVKDNDIPPLAWVSPDSKNQIFLADTNYHRPAKNF